MRLRAALVASTLAVFLIPLAASAQAVPFFGPIVPPDIASCPASWEAIIVVINRFILVLITLLIVFVAPLVIAWAGFLLVANSMNPEGKARARSLLLNLVIGIVISLLAYLIVNLIMVTLTSYGTGWTSLINWGSAPTCLSITTTPSSYQLPPGLPPGTGIIGGPATPPDGQFFYQAGINLQQPHASLGLNTLLTCMASKVPGNVGTISSISDSYLVPGSGGTARSTWDQCQAGDCQHAANSCHYGGTSCGDQSYAVDFGDEQNFTALQSAANQCGATYVALETNHVHVSVGAKYNCGCN